MHPIAIRSSRPAYSLPGRGRSVQQPAKQHGINTAPKANLSVDLDDRYAVSKSFAQRRIGVDVDQFRRQSMSAKQRIGLIAQTAPITSIDHNFHVGLLPITTIKRSWPH